MQGGENRSAECDKTIPHVTKCYLRDDGGPDVGDAGVGRAQFLQVGAMLGDGDTDLVTHGGT